MTPPVISKVANRGLFSISDFGWFLG